MPIVVDKQERREMVASVAYDLVARDGIDAVTFRQIASETGNSTAIVTNYFRNKEELLFEVYKRANHEAMSRVAAAFQAGQPLVDCVLEAMPAHDEGRRNWRVWLAFWGRAHADPAYVLETARNGDDSLKLYRRMVEGRAEAGLSDPDLQARKLLTLVAGISLEACLSPETWPVDRMRDVLESEIGKR
ncbi:TetR family transcriptional regulator [Novosphingobium marinum]|uniref:AcrR family transcriptional regulator n=1 Tax=Novosphingobium marinum TaxID=1514948 RepID=A0A7Y9XSL1_9SPHN|nr:TetR/AcrR family transcriptional regulator [Novosphingobium marinum]NYH93759.1 AcrR family transcriptional regulator [Novosphingobium marinum]GGC17090.1 TetR family transcriptional regulator [Novosphingobium marinum]